MRRIAEDICLLEGSVNGGVLIRGDAALLIDAPELPGGGSIPAALAEIGVRRVEAVLLTQHRRMYSGGLTDWPGALPPVHATPGEAALLAQAGVSFSSTRLSFTLAVSCVIRASLLRASVQ